MKAETVVLKLAIAVALTVALECPAASFLPPTNLQQPAQVINSPTAQTVDAGRPVVFYGSATGDMPLFCQWQHDGQNIPGTELYTATNGGPIYLPTSLSLASASSNDAGRYQFVVSNGFGMATSASAVLTVIYRPPVFLASPVDQSVYWGGTVTFACNVAGGPPPALQWFHNGSPLPGATASYLYPFQLESTNQAGVYSVVASNALGSVTSAVAHLTILLATPTFLTQPASLRVVEGEMAAFSAVAFGAPPPNCQWLSNGVPITGATNKAVSPSPNYSYGSQAETLLTFGGVTSHAAADYTVVAWNEAGCATSSVASLAVSPPGPLDRLRKWSLCRGGFGMGRSAGRQPLAPPNFAGRRLLGQPRREHCASRNHSRRGFRQWSFFGHDRRGGRPHLNQRLRLGPSRKCGAERPRQAGVWQRPFCGGGAHLFPERRCRRGIG